MTDPITRPPARDDRALQRERGATCASAPARLRRPAGRPPTPDIDSNPAWIEQHLPVLRGATALLRQTRPERRTCYLALASGGAAILRANVALLDQEIAHLARLTAMLCDARAILARLADRTVAAPGRARGRRPRTRPVAVAAEAETHP